MYKITSLVHTTNEVIYVNDKNKRKNSVLNTKSIAVIGVVAAVVVAFGVIMNFAVSRTTDKKQSFDGSAWKTAAEEAESSPQNNTAANEDYSQKAAAAAAEAAPQQKESTQDKDEKAKTDNAEKGLKEGAKEETQSSDSGTASITMPVRGAVTKDYSGDELVFSETMQDWRTHNGIDIFADEGTEVLAAADGVVEAVNDSGMFGKTVIILHNNEMRTIYSNLAETTDVAVGDEVKGGTKIGVVGSTAAAESAEKPHLHFEVSLNEKTVNPHDYLPEDSERESE